MVQDRRGSTGELQGMRLFGLDMITPYSASFDAEHAGKMVHYMLRWQFKDGTYSRWSETVSATITG